MFLYEEKNLMDNEEWRKIPDFPEYEVSNLGQVRRDGHILKAEIQKGGVRYHICINHIKHTVRRARVVAQAFIPNPKGLPIVMHIDGDFMNDAIVNLKWVSVSDLKNHYIAQGYSGFVYSQECVDSIRQIYDSNPDGFNAQQLS